MPDGRIRPTMPEGVNVFREIAAGTPTETGMTDQNRELSQIFQALQSGETRDLIQAREMLNKLVAQRTTRPDQPQVPETPSPAQAAARKPAEPARPAQPVAQAGAAPTAPGAPPAPTSPSAQATQPQQSPNVLNDLVKLINAASKATASPETMTAQAQPAQNPLTANRPVGRPTM